MHFTAPIHWRFELNTQTNLLRHNVASLYIDMLYMLYILYNSDLYVKLNSF